jgi:5-(carboxyamino)imidazole ribonucleotide mutase
MSASPAPVAIIMGSRSDWPTLKAAAEMLDALGVAYEAKVVSAHRTPDRMYAFAKGAKAAGFKVIIAGAGGAAHLPGMTASLTDLPVLGVPIESKTLKGVDSLYSIVQMPGGIAVGTLAIGEPGAKNAGLLAAQILALSDDGLAQRLALFRKALTDSVAEHDAASPGLDHRHSRRRPAGTDAGPGGGEAGLRRGDPGARGGQPGGAGGGARHCRRL